jgi:hypothetical protein
MITAPSSHDYQLAQRFAAEHKRYQQKMLPEKLVCGQKGRKEAILVFKFQFFIYKFTSFLAHFLIQLPGHT